MIDDEEKEMVEEELMENQPSQIINIEEQAVEYGLNNI